MTVIEKVLSDPWPPSLEVGREVPQAVHEEDCVVSLSQMCLKRYADMELATRNVIVGSLGTMISNNTLPLGQSVMTSMTLSRLKILLTCLSRCHMFRKFLTDVPALTYIFHVLFSDRSLRSTDASSCRPTDVNPIFIFHMYAAAVSSMDLLHISSSVL